MAWRSESVSDWRETSVRVHAYTSQVPIGLDPVSLHTLVKDKHSNDPALEERKADLMFSCS